MKNILLCLLVFLLFPGLVAAQPKALIIDLGSDNMSGEAIAASLLENNVTPESAASIAAADLSAYPLVFVCLGYYDGNHVLTAAESDALAAYLDQGGKLYLEGGDTWVYDDQFPVHDYFGINGDSDGTWDQLTTVNGNGLAAGISFTVPEDGIYDSVDHLTSEGSGIIIWQNSDPAYVVGVSNKTANYRTIGCSFEFGNIPDADRTRVMKAYLSFFGIINVPAKNNFLPAVFKLLL